MRLTPPLPALFWLALAFLFAPTLQASVWSAPGALSPLESAPAAPSSRSLFQSIYDRIFGSAWPNTIHEKTPKGPHHEENSPPSTAPDQLLKRYGSEVVLRFDINNDKERKALGEAADTLFLDVWQFNSEWTDIRLSKDMVDPLLGLLPQSMKSRPLIQNLAQAVFESQTTAAEAPSCPSASAKVLKANRGISEMPRVNPVFEKYQPLSVIVPWMRLLQSMFTTHVRMFSIGRTYEGRDIPAIRVGSHPHNAERHESPRKTIVISGGLHAREWISTAAVNYAAYEMITSYGKDRQTTKLMEEFDFVFIPSMNPDGYVYTWETDRLWRKNRQQTHLSFCPGLDLDRSFGYEWDGESTKDNPCSESYAGESPFSAYEAIEFANWLKNETENNNANIVGYLDLHSYSQQILYPYSYTCSQAPGNYEDLQELAIGLQKAMRNTNHKLYTVASACEGSSVWPLGGTGGGSALDWVYNQSVRYTYQIKLPDTGSYGFLLPAREIVPTGKEIYNALVYLSNFMLSSDSVDRHDESPSAKDPVMAGASATFGQKDSVAAEKMEQFISDELDDEPEDPSFELRRRR